ncbi:hypothetical protein IG631_15932 [Alternaria alternata]|nr:hypothetical protein IG631_15932 [Alternaria alternata]
MPYLRSLCPTPRQASHTGPPVTDSSPPCVYDQTSASLVTPVPIDVPHSLQNPRHFTPETSVRPFRSLAHLSVFITGSIPYRYQSNQEHPIRRFLVPSAPSSLTGYLKSFHPSQASPRLLFLPASKPRLTPSQTWASDHPTAMSFSRAGPCGRR